MLKIDVMTTKSNKRGIKGIFAALFLVACTGILISAQDKVADEGLEIGGEMPLANTKMLGSDGSNNTLANLKGENGLIVVFSCNTCPFVVGSDNFAGWEGQYNAIHEKAKSAKMGMVLVNSNAGKRADVDSQEAMKTHAESLGYTMPYLIDTDAQFADAVGAKTTPHVYVFDSNSKLIYKGSIDNSWDTQKIALETYLLDAMDAISTGVAITQNNTTPRGCSIKRNK